MSYNGVRSSWLTLARNSHSHERGVSAGTLMSAALLCEPVAPANGAAPSIPVPYLFFKWDFLPFSNVDQK